MNLILEFLFGRLSIVLIIVGIITFFIAIKLGNKYYSKKWIDRDDTMFAWMIIFFVIAIVFFFGGLSEISRDITRAKLPIGKAVEVQIDYDVINCVLRNHIKDYNSVLVELREDIIKSEVVRRKGNDIDYILYLRNGEEKIVEAEIFYHPYFKIKKNN